MTESSNHVSEKDSIQSRIEKIRAEAEKQDARPASEGREAQANQWPDWNDWNNWNNWF